MQHKNKGRHKYQKNKSKNHIVNKKNQSRNLNHIFNQYIPKILKNIFLGVVVIIILLFLVDMLLVNLHLVTDEFGQYDAELWTTLKPNSSGYYKPAQGPLVKISINSDGFRDYEFSRIKNNNTYRILMLGDSHVALMHVNLNETTAKTLEGILNRNVKTYSMNYTTNITHIKKIEVYNLGVAGYSPVTEYLLLNKTMEKFHPDMVIFIISTSTDVSQSNYELNGKSFPYITLENDQITYHKTEKSMLYKIKDKIGFVFKNIQRVLYIRFQELQAKLSKKVVIQDTGRINLYLKEQPPQYRQAWMNLGIILNESNALCMKNNCQFVAITLNNGEQINTQTREQLLKQNTPIKLGYIDFDRPQKDFINECQKHNITCFNTLDEMRIYSMRSDKPLATTTDDHYNTYGAQVSANIISEQIWPIIARH